MRYNHSAPAVSLGDKLKAAARNQSVDVNTAASRHVGERFVHHLQSVLTVPIMLTGGYLFPQHLRQTADADIKTVRRLSNREMQNAYKTLKPILALEGIELHEFSREPSIIAIAYGEPVDRYYIKATCGTIRGNTNIDISSGNTPGSFPRDVAWRDIPSIMKGGPVLRARCQPLAAAAAEKLLAVLMQPSSDGRVKHFADIANERLWDGIDCRQVATELTRICGNRGIPMSVCAERSPALAWTAVSAREAEWAKHMAAGKTHRYARSGLAGRVCDLG